MEKVDSHIQLEQTADGSNTLFVPELNEHYHSVKGALTESRYIFVHLGLEHAVPGKLRILEIGFGTGLNAFLTLLAAKKLNKQIHYTGIELYPLSEKDVRILNYPQVICPEHSDDFYHLHTSPWQKDVSITTYFTLHKIKDDFTRFTFRQTFDLIYFDAFAPEKQPEMWTQELFDSLYVIMRSGGI